MPSLTLGDLQDRVYQSLDRNTLLYPLAEVTDYINEAVLVIGNITGFLQKQVVLPSASQANRVWYDVPADILVPFKLVYDKRYLLNKMSLTKIGCLYPNWTTERSAVVGSPVARWVPVGLTKFGIHPADSNGGAEMRISGIQVPVTLSDPNQVVPFPNEYMDSVEDLVVMSIQLKEVMPIQQAMNSLYPRFLDKMSSQNRWRNVIQPGYPQERKSRQ